MYGSTEAPVSWVKRITAIGIGLVLFVGLIMSGMLVEKVDANEILIIQHVRGQVSIHVSPGIVWQGFGRVTSYPKVLTYPFEGPIRFNEGGHGKVVGSIQFRLPLNEAILRSLYESYTSADALKAGLLAVITDKSIFMTGPLLSSTESYAEKRSNLIFWIEDQIVHGVYRTTRRDLKMKDPITGEDKTVTVAEIAMTDGKPQRQEQSQLEAFGVTAFNFAVSDIAYDKIVEDQIAAQQRNAMAVNTAVAEARKAEQQALTAEQTGRANAATARWEKETEKAAAVVVAQQELEVASLDARAALQERAANIARGEGEAARRRLLMQADNALEAKLAAYVNVMTAWAENAPKYQGAWVPGVVMGNSGQSANGANALIDMLSAKTARDLGLNLTTRRGEQQ